MAFYSFGRIKIISRTKTKSAVGTAAYHAGIDLKSEYDGSTFHFSNKQYVGETYIKLPAGVPAHWSDETIPAKERVGVIWNDIELAHPASNAQLARMNFIALPHDLSLEEGLETLDRWIEKNCTSKGMGVVYSVHGIPGNRHVDMMYFISEYDSKGKPKARQQKQYLCRRADGTEKYMNAEQFNHSKGFGKVYRYTNPAGEMKELTLSEVEKLGSEWVRKNKHPVSRTIKISGWDDYRMANRWRKSWEEELNKKYAEKNMKVRVDCRSYEERGMTKKPTIHEGYGPDSAERKQYNNDVKQYNAGVEQLLTTGNEALRDIRTQVSELKSNPQTKETVQEHKERFSQNKNLLQLILDSDLLGRKATNFFKKHLKQLEKEFNSLCKAVVKGLEALKNKTVQRVEGQIQSIDTLIANAIGRSAEQEQHPTQSNEKTTPGGNRTAPSADEWEL